MPSGSQDSDGSFEMRAWCWSSSILEQRTGNKAFRSIERLPLDSATRQTLVENLDAHEAITSKGTTLSTWFPRVRAGSSYDDILIEECISLGRHGALTILRPSQEPPGERHASIVPWSPRRS